MNFNNQMTRELLKVGCKVMPTRTFSGVDKVEEYIKWLSYVPEEKSKIIKRLENKKTEELSIEEIDELIEYKEEQKILAILITYEKGRYDVEKVIEALEYIDSNPIEEIMDYKLTKKEKEESQKQIESYTKLSLDELMNKVNNESILDNYLELSMIDAYILYYISRDYRSRSLNKLDKNINESIKENDTMKAKSIKYASNSYLN